MRHGGIALFLLAAVASADTPQFRFAKGETLRYQIVQTTQIDETVLEEKTNQPMQVKHGTKAQLVRQWKVTDVDSAGVATLEMSIASMVWEQTLPNGERDIFDSSKPDELNKQEMAKLVGPVLATLRVDARGQVVEVKDSKVGPAHRFQSDLPFKMLLPGKAITVGDQWDRKLTLQLDPPHGTGEKYEALQTFRAVEPKGGFITLELGTQLKSPPEQASDQIPLLPMQLGGIAFFHAESGRYYGSRLKLEKELKDHQGEGSRYKFVSTYVEDFLTK